VTPIAAWQNFYVIVGSAAAALTGLQFVVMALVADLPMQGREASIDAFGTPTIVHFGTVLLLSAVAAAPWHGVSAPMILCGVCGAIGLVYVIIVSRRAHRQTEYKPVFEDWLFHVLLPAVAYGVLAGSAYGAQSYTEQALFGVAASSMLLLFIGIHNAWDTVTYLVITRGQQPDKDPKHRDKEPRHPRR
jgi:hypothetical protein